MAARSTIAQRVVVDAVEGTAALAVREFQLARLGSFLLRALQDLLASGDCDAGPTPAIVASLLTEWQTGIDFTGCSACRAVR